MQRLAVAFVSGALFGLGLCVSQMVNPHKVLAFLDLAGAWDPSLGVVMAGALGVTLISFRFILKRPKPMLAGAFSLTTRQAIDGRLVGGAALFGIGWGLAGFCPGPAVASLAYGMPKGVLFFAAMICGMLVYHRLFNRS